MLIEKVALAFIKSRIDEARRAEGGISRFCMLGIARDLVERICIKVLEDKEMKRLMDVWISHSYGISHPALSSCISVPGEMATLARNKPLSGQEKIAMLFAATHEESQSIGNSLGPVAQINTDLLCSCHDYWISCSGLADLAEENQKIVKAAITAVNTHHIARGGISDFEAFVNSICENAESKHITNAIDASLHALKLPNESAQSSSNIRNHSNSAAWGKVFEKICTDIRPYLFLENKNEEDIYLAASANFKKLCDKRELNEKEIDVITRFFQVRDDLIWDKWFNVQDELVRLDWQRIRPVFEGVPGQGKHLGEATIEFFETNYPDELTESWKRFLAPKFPKNPRAEDFEFFDEHRIWITKHKRLIKRWEKYLYDTQRHYDDFLVAIVESLQRIRNWSDEAETNLRLKIKLLIDESFYEQAGKNKLIARFFAYRYNGINKIFGDKVEFDFDKLYKLFMKEEPSHGSDKWSKDARSLKFEISLFPAQINPAEAEDEDDKAEKLIFHWEMPADAIPLYLPDDLHALIDKDADCSLLYAPEVAVQQVSSKGFAQHLSLKDSKTMRTKSSSSEAGCLVSSNIRESLICSRFPVELKRLTEEHVIAQDLADDILSKYSEFHSAYTQALKDWLDKEGHGIASPSIANQAQIYGELLKKVADSSASQDERRSLLALLMKIGIANVGEGANAAIIVPWHPLRMAELGVKTNYFRHSVEMLLNASFKNVDHADKYYEELRREIELPYYPEVCVGDRDGEPNLLAIVESLHGYSVAEQPNNKRADYLDYSLVDPKRAASCFGQISGTYLDLLPHEKSSFSAILFNTEPQVPKAIADEMAKMVEKSSELQCDLLLTHVREGKVRKQYGQQNTTLGDAAGSSLASETAMNFLSRLRVGVIQMDEVERDEEAGKSSDIVFLQDVVADFGEIKWIENDSAANDYDPKNHIPVGWSKRKPIGPGDLSSTIYMTWPAQPKFCQQYLDALHSLLKDTASDGKNRIPVKSIDFGNKEVHELFDKVHKAGDWVINFDELVDRRLLEREGIRTIRNIFNQQAGRNVIVSTTSQTDLLQNLLVREISNLIGNIEESEAQATAGKLIARSAELSGHVVMKAAKHGRYAKELIGLVLSMERIQSFLGESKIGWYFLDDYLDLFSRKEEHIADILAIAPLVREDGPCLGIVICEAKYVGSRGQNADRKRSSIQLTQTMQRINTALSADGSERIDRDYWLGKIANMMTDHMTGFGRGKINGWELQQWAEKVRQGEIPIVISGYSYVFVTDSVVELEEMSERVLDYENAAQLVFPHDSVKRQLQDFAADRMPGTNTLENIPGVDGSGGNSAKSGSRSVSEPALEKPSSDENITAEHSGPAVDVPVQEETQEPDTEEKSADAVSSSLREWLRSYKKRAEQNSAQEWLASTTKELRRALVDYKLEAYLVDSRLSPNAALITFKGSNDLTVPKVEKKRQELFTTHGLNVIAVEPAPKAVQINISRPDRQILPLRELWGKREFADDSMQNNSLLIAETENEGKPLYLNIDGGAYGYAEHAPHTLVAGETGGGKGVLVQTMLLDICATNSPSHAQIIMIDPKNAVDYPWLKNFPHLKESVVTKKEEAAGILERLTSEMDRRYSIFGEAGVNKLSAYNKKVGSDKVLPRIWLFHEEFADWMIDEKYRSAVDKHVSRLGTKSRAAGIHLVMIAQRPDNRVFPMQLRANLGNRLILKMADRKNSELVLDEPGAENLLGKGHLVAKLTGEKPLIYAQVPFIEDSELDELAGLIVKMWSE